MLGELGIAYLPAFMAGHSSRVFCLDWSPDGEVLLRLNSGGSVRGW